MKKVLVLCTGNSCRSIIAQAIINDKLGDKIKAYSCGVKALGIVNPLAKKILQEKNIWKDEYYSKDISKVLDIDFDLAITVCDNAYENCPIFPKKTKILHQSFDDPTGKEYNQYKITYDKIQKTLLPQIQKILI
jgi:arsenate reductase